MSKHYNLDDILDDLNAKEAREVQKQSTEQASKLKIGEVENYFSKISVAAVRLTGPLALGDIIEIGSEENAIRQKVESMQIDRKDVSIAKEGDSVGILVRCKVNKGEEVYKIVK
ncbi:MAG: hypothetical protein RXP92_00135 [Candidatus Micrarchaeota archaeon]|jgi:putative protease